MKASVFGHMQYFLMSLVTGVLTPLSLQAGSWERIYHNIAGKPGYEVPGLTDTGFKFSSNPAANSLSFFRIAASGNGNWVLTGRAELPTLQDDVLIVNGQLVARQGAPFPITSGETYGDLLNDPVEINNAGTVAFSNRTNGANGADSQNVYLVTATGGILSPVAKTGQSTGLAAFPGTVWTGNAPSRANVLDNGKVSFDGTVSGQGVTPGIDNWLLIIESQVIAQTGVTVPGNQVGGTTFPIDVPGDFSVSGDGSHYIFEASLTGEDGSLSKKSAIVDGNVVIQQNYAAPGMFFPVDTVFGVHMDNGGNWFARGVNKDGQDWIIRNNQVVAAELEPIGSGLSNWAQFNASSDNAFSLMAGNNVGDWLIGGWDDSGVGGSPQALLVLNGGVIARQGDPIDLDGNGMADDDAYFGNRFQSAAIADNGTVYVTATLQNGGGISKGAGFFVMHVVPEPGPIATLLGAVAILVFRRYPGRKGS